MQSKTDHYFITIVKKGSLQKAAEALYVAQPSLSKYIQRLEKQLGVRLFDRSVSPMRLTEAGNLYYAYLLRREEQAQNLRNSLSQLASEQRGVLRLGIPSYCGQCYLPPVLEQFHAQYPDVTIRLYEGHGAAIEKALQDRQIDLAILHLPMVSEDLYYEPLFTETVLLAEPGSSREIPLRSLEDFSDRPFIMPHPEQKLGRIVSDGFSRTNFVPDVFLRTENVMTMLCLVSRGMGVGFLPAGGLSSLPADIAGLVRFCRIRQLDSAEWKLVAVHRKGYHPPAYDRAFTELFARYGARLAEGRQT